MIKYLPDALSVLRLVLSCVMFALNPDGLFVALYLLCGLSDVADGAIARHWRVQSLRGARLDSIADIAMFAVGIKYLLFDKAITLNRATLYLLGCVVAVRLLNLVVVRVRFGLWASCHTYCNKLVGAFVFALVPIVGFCGEMPVWIIPTVAATALVAATEESVIVLSAKRFAPDRKSFFDF